MRVIIEDYQYPAEAVDKVLWDGAFQTVDGKVSIGYVGYYWNEKLRESVFMLPKVMLNQADKVFDKYAPEEIIDIDESPLTKDEREFLYGFAVWIYLHRDWVFRTRSKYKRYSVYNVRLGDRPGAVVREEKVRTPKFVILYEEADDKCYRVFRVHHAVTVKNERMARMAYPHPTGDYFCYFLDEEVSLGELDVHKIRMMYRHLRDPVHAFAPLYISGKQLAAGVGL